MKKAWIVYIATVVLFVAVLAIISKPYTFKNVIIFPEPQEARDSTPFRINPNTATAEDLQIIPGVGPSLADTIIAYREENGPFYEYVDLLNVPGIGTAKLETMLEYIIID